MNEGGHQIRLGVVGLAVLVILAAAMIWVIALVLRNALPVRTDSEWSKPVPMAGARALFHWNKTVAYMEASGSFRFLRDDGKWIQGGGFELAQDEGCSPVMADAAGKTAVFYDLKFSNKVEAIPSLISAEAGEGGKIDIVSKTPLQPLLKEIFGEAPPRQGFDREITLQCWSGAMNGSGIYVPYTAGSVDTIETITRTGTHQKRSQAGPEYFGAFFSPDAGRTWQRVGVGKSAAAYFATMEATAKRLLLLQTENQNLQVTTSSVDSSDWSQPKLLVGTVADSRFLTESAGDTVHVCWMDMRLKKGVGFFIHGDWDIGRKNNQVFYRGYDEAVGTWAEERKLSGNLHYCESPSMSVEGKKIVVIWRNMEKPYTRAAIYFVTSNDGGQTWAKLKKIENSEEVAGSLPCPMVILHRGVIHLFYNGMYQCRQFPE